VRDTSAAWIRAGAEASLRALSTDYIDLYQVQWPDPATTLQQTAIAEAATESLTPVTAGS
jgi:hypothetical protein